MGVKTRNLSNTVGLDIEWQGVQTGNFTAVAGRGYFIDTTSNTVEVTLPASPSVGDIVQFKDYARTWNTNNVTTASALVDGASVTSTFSTSGQTVTLVYMDGTKGWSLINEDTTSTLGPLFIEATGGTITTSGDYKIHTFTGDGCFVVSCAGDGSASVPSVVDYLVVAGGGGGGSQEQAGGGAAGGFRESKASTSPTHTASPHTASPLVATSGITVTATTYPITVGAGGAGVSGPGFAETNGSNSVFSTITSTGGGKGGSGCQNQPVPGCFPHNGSPGGSGGGGGTGSGTGGSGNTPPTSPSQGFPGGVAGPSDDSGPYGGGGGGASIAGTHGIGQTGVGGDGVTTSISGSPTAYAGGGGGGGYTSPGIQASGGTGGGGTGAAQPSPTKAATSGTANTGGGGGGAAGGNSPSGAGGKGIVIIRYKFQ